MNMAPNYMHEYRHASTRSLPLNHAKRACQGECGKSKSVGQFAGDSTICIRCTNRAPKKRSPKTEGAESGLLITLRTGETEHD